MMFMKKRINFVHAFGLVLVYLTYEIISIYFNVAFIILILVAYWPS